jgi:ArsR family transcriptional regulator
MQDVMDALKALGDDNRVRIMLALQDGELCVCQLIELLQLAPSTVSKHLSILRSARLVESRKDSRWMFYQLSKTSRFPMQMKLFAMISKSLKDTSQAKADKKQLAKIKKMDTDVLCKKTAK